MPVILAVHEPEFGIILVLGQPGQKKFSRFISMEKKKKKTKNKTEHGGAILSA
jgi:hypothetical protein